MNKKNVKDVLWIASLGASAAYYTFVCGEKIYRYIDKRTQEANLKKLYHEVDIMEELMKDETLNEKEIEKQERVVAKLTCKVFGKYIK